ncbi:MAG: hypothetical protein ACR2GY_04305 [Phycisphaerales bacterium]
MTRVFLPAVATAALLITAACSNTDTVQTSDRSVTFGSRADVSRVNDFTFSTQERISVDVTPEGRIVAAWDSRRQQDGRYGVYARVLDATGQPLSNEIQINVWTAGHQRDAAVAADTTRERFWVAWASTQQDGSGEGIVLRLFDAVTAQPISQEIAVNVSRAGDQSNPSIAVDAEGQVLVAWTSPLDHPSTARTLCARLFSAEGGALSDELRISNNDASTTVLTPTLAADGANGFVVAWSEHVSGHVRGARILATRIITSASNAERVIATLSAADEPSAIEPSIDVDAEGIVTAAWLSADADGNLSARMQRFDTGLEPLTPALRVSEQDARWVSGVSVACDNAGHSFVTFNQLNDEHDLDVMMQAFDPKGNAVTSSAQPLIAGGGVQMVSQGSSARRVVFSPNGQRIVAFAGDAQLGDDSGVHVHLAIAPEASRGLHMLAQAQQRMTTFNPALLNESPMDRNVGEHAAIPPVWDPQPELPPLPINPLGPAGAFAGISDTGWNPPDPEIAVGPNHYVQVVNDQIAFYDRAGTLLYLDDINEPDGFFGEVGGVGFVFDPECLFDPHSQRFFVMANERDGGRSYYDVAVSDDDNPVGEWHKYRIDVTNVDTDIDSPNMAVDADVLYLSADFFGPDKYQVLMIEKAPLLSGGAINSREIVIIGQNEQSMGLPIIYDADAPAGYLLQSAENSGPPGLNFNEVRIHGIRNQLTSPTRVTIDIPVPIYSYPNQPPQAGSSTRPFLFEPRFWSTMYVNGSLWAVHHVNGDRARVRWYEFRMNNWPDSGTPTLRQWGELDYGGQVHTFFPSIAADADGNAAIIFARSSPTEFISIGAAVRRGSDPLNEFRPMFFVKESTSTSQRASRWGDYSHIEPDPINPGSFVGTHEWTDTPNAWRTWIAPIDTGPALATLTSINIPFGSLIAGGIPELLESDNVYLRAQSAFGFQSTAPNLLRLDLDFDVDANATSLEFTAEARLNNPSGTARIFMRNWNANAFNQVGTYAIGTTEQSNGTSVADATDFVSVDGKVRVRLQYSVVATFSVSGFVARVDLTQLGY